MIHELSGDLLLSKADLIVHGVAPNDDFKNGIALALREACPAMYANHPRCFLGIPWRPWL